MPTLIDSSTPAAGLPPEPIRRPSSGNLADRLDAALRGDPAFQVMTVDGTHWIDPFTGKRVAAPFGHFEPARQYLLSEQPWTRTKRKRIEELHLFRWRLHLHQNGERDLRLRHFAPDGRWLNPYSGEWLPTSHRGTGMTATVLREMAAYLADCPQAQNGRMLPRHRIDDLVQSAQPGSGKITTRISGWRAGRQETLPFTPAPGSDPDLAVLRDTIENLFTPLPSIAGFGFAVHYEPYVGVGGDFYDCTRIDDHRFFIAIGDVSGHGRQSALTAMGALKALHAILPTERGLVSIVTRLNDEVRRDLPKGQFITFFAAILDTETRRLTCICAGHHPALLASKMRPTVLTRIGGRAPALGLISGTALRETLQPEEIRLRQGDLLFLYTDGLSEAKDGLHSEFGECRVMASVIAQLDAPYDRLVSSVVADVRRFAEDALDDDLTIMALAMEAEDSPTPRPSP